MKLKDAKLTPVGGWRFEYSFDPTERFPAGFISIQKNDSKDLRDFQKKVHQFFIVNDIPIPDYLDQLVEDFICTRQPSDRCFYTSGFGDQLSRAIHGAAGVVDTVLRTNLQSTARKCRGCSRRRTKLN